MKPKRQAGKRTRRMYVAIRMESFGWWAASQYLVESKKDAVANWPKGYTIIPVDVPVGRTRKEK